MSIVTQLRNRWFSQQQTYVKDGLVLWLDGIDNSGLDVHSDSLSTWVDLSGNAHNAAKAGSTTAVVVNNDNLDFSSTSDGHYKATGGFWKIQTFTIDVCFAFVAPIKTYDCGPVGCYGRSRNAGYCFLFGKQSDADGKLRFVWGGAAGSHAIDDVPIEHGRRVGVSVAVGEDIELYSGGAKYASIPNEDGVKYDESVFRVGLVNENTYAYRSFNGSICCVRLYNRALTPQEIAHNYSIDKRRFNLQ